MASYPRAKDVHHSGAAATVDQQTTNDAPLRPPHALLSLRLDAAGFPCTNTDSPTGAVAKW